MLFPHATPYDLHRPSSPPALVEKLLTAMSLTGTPDRASPNRARILDLGAGTGKLTEQLAAHREQFELVAVEPGREMREVLARKGLERVQVLEGSAEKVPVGDAGVEGVVVAQAFHYFATTPVLTELHRLLTPHGSLGLIWNIDAYNAPQSQKPPTAYEKTMQTLLFTLDAPDEQPRYRHQRWREVFDEGQVGGAGPWKLLVAGPEQRFSLPLGEDREAWTVWLGPEEVWERFATLSQVAALNGEAMERAYKTVMDALNAPDIEKDDQGRVPIHGESVAVWTSKIPEEGRASLTEVERPGA